MEAILSVVSSQTNGAADGTGVLKLVDMSKELLGSVPDFLLEYTLGIQLSIFGDYAQSSDVAPSAIFSVVFFIFMGAHLFVFTKNYLRGHKFWLSLGFAFSCLLRFLGYVLRIVWATDILKMKQGIASNVFLIVPIVFLASFNLVLAQRIFTWRHPHIGSTKLFWGAMIGTYVIVTGVVVMAIVGAVIPYLYFLSASHFTMCKKAVRTSALLCVLYSVLSVNLVAGAYLIKPTRKALKTITFQPWWIESFEVFWYVPKGKAQEAEESFRLRDPTALDHHRIIASTTQHHETIEVVKTVSSKSGKLEHNTSILIIFITSLMLLTSSTFRCVSTFIAKEKAGQSWLFHQAVGYVMFGALEIIVHLIYLLGRVDLRFYRPDRLSKRLVSECSSGGSVNSKKGDSNSRDSNDLENEKGLAQTRSVVRSSSDNV